MKFAMISFSSCMLLLLLQEMTSEMKKRLGDVVCIAPWTTLSLGCEFDNERKKKGRL